MTKVTVISFCYISSFQVAYSQGKFDVFFLSVGSEHYEHNPRSFKEKDFIPYDDLPEASYSAKVVAEILLRNAEANGAILTSKSTKRISKKWINSAIDSMESVMRMAKQPLFVFYYCGHGISENMGWNQFLIPGDYTSVAGTKKIGDLADDLIFLGDITDRLDKLNIRYLVLVDCCRKEEGDNSLPEARLRHFFDKQNVETFRTVVMSIKALNEYRQINPVVFSIAPGNSAPLVDHPDVKSFTLQLAQRNDQVGPICRRLLLVLDSKQYEGISLQKLIESLTSSSLDQDSPTSVSFYLQDEDNEKDRNVLAK